MELPRKIVFTFMGIDITVDQYLSYQHNHFYEWRTPEGLERSSLHIDMNYETQERAVHYGMISVYNYFNGDPDKSIAL